MRHNVNQALVQLQQWDELRPLIDQARPIAAKQASAAEPSGGDEDAAAQWKSRKEYAEGVVQWLEWATNTAAMQAAQPQTKVEWLNSLVENYPEGQYAKGVEARYVAAYQQAGDQENMVAWMKKAVEAGSQDETYYYTLGEDAVNKNDAAAAKTYGEKALEILESKAPPEGTTAEQWAAHKEKISAYTNFMIGRSIMPQNTKDAYRSARTYLLKSVDVLKAEGGTALSRAGVLPGRLLRAARHPRRQHQAGRILDAGGRQDGRPVQGAGRGGREEDRSGAVKRQFVFSLMWRGL